MVAPEQRFPLVRWAVLVCSFDEIGTQAHARRVTPTQSPFNSAQLEKMNEEMQTRMCRVARHMVATMRTAIFLLSERRGL
jgi:hypothetical protein